MEGGTAMGRLTLVFLLVVVCFSTYAVAQDRSFGLGVIIGEPTGPSFKRLPFYFGVGGRIKIEEGKKEDKIGVRIPVGLDYLFADTPLDIFVEVVPVLDLVPDTDLDFNAAVGIRYLFK